MLDAVVIIGVIAAVAAITMAPLFMPWPQQVRWIVANASIADPFAMGASVSPVSMREATVGSVHQSGERVDVELSVPGPMRGSAFTLMPAETPTPDAAFHLRYWMLARTPLLVCTEANGDVSLYGPEDTVVGLHPCVAAQ